MSETDPEATQLMLETLFDITIVVHEIRNGLFGEDDDEEEETEEDS